MSRSLSVFLIALLVLVALTVGPARGASESSGTPTTITQCQNGGWQSFDVFRNQGDCVSFVATKGRNPPGNSPTGWFEKAPAATARLAVSAATIKRIVYVVGGHTGTAESGALEAYDPATNRWTTRAALPTPRHNAGVGAINGKLYVAGGWSQDLGGSVSTVEAYDPSTNTWATRASLPLQWSPGNASGGVLNGQLYLFGGDTAHPNGVCDSRVMSYDPASDTWTTRAPMPQSECWGATAVANGKAYVIGGISCCGRTPYSTVQIYDPATDSWTMGAAMPTARHREGAAFVDGLIFVIGGGATFGLLGSMDAYDPFANTWSSKPAMPTPRQMFAAASVGATIFTIAGVNASGTPVNVSEAFTAR